MFFSFSLLKYHEFNSLDVFSRFGPFYPQKYDCEYFTLHDKHQLYVLTIKSAAISNDSYEINEFEVVLLCEVKFLQCVIC